MGTLKVDTILNTASETSVKVDRTTSDGTVLDIQKDGTSVGSINSFSSADMTIGSGDVRLRFDDANDRVVPRNASDSARDNAIDLGGNGVRFKDCYLGGALYVGGTQAANALDDYEEGTWTPTFNRDVDLASVAYSRQTGVYIKIGQTVVAWFDMIVTSYSGGGGDYGLYGLPFTSNLGSSNGGYGIPSIRAATLMPTDFKIYGNSSYHNTNTDYFYFRNYNSSGTEVASSPNGSGRVSGFTIYTTSS